MSDVLEDLYEVIERRKDADKNVSYVAKIFSKGREKIAQKMGEEAVETVVAALAESKTRLVEETADLMFHLLILLAERGVTLKQVYDELENRMKNNQK